MSAEQAKKLYAAQPENAGGWFVLSHDADGFDEIGSGDGGFEEIDARRLAASWNACLLMSTKFLESVPSHTLKTLIEVVNERDALLDALKAITPFIPRSSASDGGANRHSAHVAAADKVRAAIAKVQGAS